MVAPAFARPKKTKREEAAAEYEALMNGSASTSAPRYMSAVLPEYEGQTLGAWNNWGRAPSGTEVIGQDADALFLKNDELMDDDQQFSFNGKPAKGQRKASGKITIASEIGGQVIGRFSLESESRLEQLDDDGNYTGRHLGQIKKRKLEEYKDRARARNAEKAAICAVLDEWNSLSQEERDRRKHEAEKNQAQILKTVEIIEDEEIPEQYLFSRLTLRDSTLRAQVLAGPDQPEAADFLALDESNDGDGLPFLDEPASKGTNLPNEGNRSLRSQDIYERRAPAIRRDHIASLASPISTSIGSSGYGTPTDSTTGTPGGFHMAGHGRFHERRRRPRPRSHRSTPVPKDIPAHQQWKSQQDLAKIGSTSTLEVSNPKPRITPFQDVEQSLFVTDQIDFLSDALRELSFECSTQPRVVVIKLHPNVAYSSQMLLSKVHGARLQEVQFFPDELEAVLVFVDPREAQAFIDHVEAARKKNDHEFRRLQIASAWFGGKDRMYGIYGMQQGLAKIVISENASRAIKVSGIANDMQPQALETYFKSHFPHLVGLRLIRPIKNFEKQKENNVVALLDFSSIFHASAAKTAFNVGNIPNFTHCTADWLTDPCAKPNDPAAWCTCLFCADQNTNQQVTPGSQFGMLHGRNAEHLNMARVQRKEGLTYDFEEDADRPETFRRYDDRGAEPMERDLGC